MPYKDKAVAARKRREYEQKFPFISVIKNIKARIKKEQKNIPFNLSKKWAKESTGLCELSGLPFRGTVKSRVSGPYSGSVDRKIPELGYIEGNCRKILNGLNGLKHTGTDEDMYIIAEALLKNRKK